LPAVAHYGKCVVRFDPKQVVRVLWGRRDDWRLRKPVRPDAPHPGAHWLGPVAMVGASLVGWYAFDDAIGREGNVAFALFIGSVSILLMAFSFVLATRLRLLEPFFGGLDRMYRWHRWFGALAVAAMWLHVQNVDDVKGIRGASKSVAEAAEELAGTAETILYVLVAVSLIRWVPYRWWRQLHKLLIVPYLFACWHFHTATKPYANDSAWGRWFQAIMVLGIGAWLWRVVWRDGVRRGHRYRIESISRSGTITTIDMAPVGAALRHSAGQFAFFRFGSRSAAEPHPFTIASAPDDPLLRIHVKNLGDWSDRIGDRLVIGDPVRVEGPYGKLRPLPRRPRTTVWVAGGVGITPFLGAVRSLRDGDVVPHLFYAVRSRDDAAGLSELTTAASAGRVALHLHVSREGHRLRSEDLLEIFGASRLRDAHVVMCGPDAMIRDMSAAVRNLGARRVHVEAFDIRTGIGPDLSRKIASLREFSR
jgi:predicted ferric reductase